MTDRAQLRSEVFDAIVDLLVEVSELPPEGLTRDTPLVGRHAAIRSLELVELLVLVEEYALNELNVTFDWTDDSALSPTNSAFRTIGSLTDRLVETTQAP